MLGGTHMTNPALLVNRILKELTATEDNFYGWYYILGSHQIILRLRGFVNTKYLFSMTEEDADKEQQKLYRWKIIIHMFFKNIGTMTKHYILTSSKDFSLQWRPCWLANTDPVGELSISNPHHLLGWRSWNADSVSIFHCNNCIAHL